MKNTAIKLLIAFSTAIILASCNSGPEPLYDLSDTSYPLRNIDSSRVYFPDDFEGEISVISFIFTHCPDVCPAITANMSNIQRGLKDTTDIQFIEISFDPQRDTPSVLKAYKKRYKLNDQFTFLTGQPETVDSLLKKMEIVAVKTFSDSLVQDSSNYNMRHSNTIYLMDKNGRIRAEYPASVIPPEHVIEDIQSLRNL
ncbi:SCO family protein [Fodinibius halophilus]|uniref:SCO family protein n=1 Tax=Fodinibius halophilus TaxID=1736908 RepID=A0A6M1T9D8_9BACT|nr:SCO family protein [Fodinibius halophilus]NGP87654.1 SCO family protein [Fodinibius halophilus]